jgi:hypothetical protein
MMSKFTEFMTWGPLGKDKTKELLFGKDAEELQMSTMTPEQQQFLSQFMGGLGEATPQMFQYLNQLLSGDSQSYNDFAAPMMRQFQEETIPGIAERFGGMGAQSSSGFQQSLGKAGAGLQENLAALRSQLQMQATNQLQGMIGQGLGTKSFENLYMPAQPGMIQGMAQGAGQALGQAGASAMMA